MGESKLTRLSIILIFLLFTSQILGQSRTYHSLKVNGVVPSIDGWLDDDAWNQGEWQNKFKQYFPYNGNDATEKTEFKLLHDDAFIYLAIRAYDTEPENIEERLGRKDNWDGDWVQVMFDSYFDKRTAYGFLVNAASVKMDELLINDSAMGDPNWEAVWEAETNIDYLGWTCEMKIPLNQLRFDSNTEQIWGLQVSRMLARKNEMSTWNYIDNTTNQWVSKFGELRGMDSIEHTKQFDIIPYTVGKIETLKKDNDDPFSQNSISNILGGFDGKVGITNDLTLDFTVNPDFGQVEADPSEVNLSGFETFLQEKRPFFIEGKNILDFKVTERTTNFNLRQDNLFYTRRIGSSPKHYPDLNDDEYVDMPLNTHILGAAKLTGKTKDGLSIGVMETVTREEIARIDLNGNRRDLTVEPLTNYFIGRIQKDFDEGNTIIGGMFTATNRNLNHDDLNFLHKGAYTAGLDFNHKWDNNKYYVQGNVLASHVAGDREAITETQESSRRYFQRPDADYVSVDTNRTSLTGFGGSLITGKQGGSFRYLLGYTWRSPELELNDVGYMRKADEQMTWGWVGFFKQEPFSIFKFLYAGINYWKGWNFGQENLYEFIQVNSNINFKNNFRLYTEFTRASKSLRPEWLRGGPAITAKGGFWHNFNFNTDEQKKWQLGLFGFNYWGDDNWSRDFMYTFRARFNPITQLQVSIEPSVAYHYSEIQHVANEEANGVDKFIIGDMSQDRFSLNFRLNFSITPDLSIEYYGQPFIAVGKFTRFKEVVNARAFVDEDKWHQFSDNEISYDLDDGVYSVDRNNDGETDYSFDSPDFNLQKFISNLVVRWEYIPGSTLYLVWSQGRSGDSSYNNLSFSRDMKDLFRVYPHNIFLLKFSYRLNI